MDDLEMRLSKIESALADGGVNRLAANFTGLCKQYENLCVEFADMERKLEAAQHNVATLSRMLIGYDVNRPQLIVPTRPLVKAMIESLTMLDESLEEGTCGH